MRRPSLVLLLSTGSALRPTTPRVKSSALGKAADQENTLKQRHAAQPPTSGRASQRLNAAALEEELKTNTPYWYDDRIHSFGNVGFGGVFASVCASRTAETRPARAADEPIGCRSCARHVKRKVQFEGRGIPAVRPIRGVRTSLRFLLRARDRDRFRPANLKPQ